MSLEYFVTDLNVFLAHNIEITNALFLSHINYKCDIFLLQSEVAINISCLNNLILTN